MGHNLDFCKTCEEKRNCDMCAKLARWIEEHKDEKQKAQSKVVVTEEAHLEKEWFEQAKVQTLETLREFVYHVMNDYEHDYGTICHAISACAIAAAAAANSEPQGGITGFQASLIMWDFVKQWSYPQNKCGLRILNFDDMLYPQYGNRFDKTISQKGWELVQKEAQRKLEEDRGYSVHPEVEAHWRRIVEGVVPHGFTIKPDSK